MLLEAEAKVSPYHTLPIPPLHTYTPPYRCILPFPWPQVGEGGDSDEREEECGHAPGLPRGPYVRFHYLTPSDLLPCSGRHLLCVPSIQTCGSFILTPHYSHPFQFLTGRRLAPRERTQVLSQVVMRTGT